MEEVRSETESSDQITGEEEEGPQEQVAPGNGKQSGTGLAEKLDVSRAHGIMGQKI